MCQCLSGMSASTLDAKSTEEEGEEEKQKKRLATAGKPHIVRELNPNHTYFELKFNSNKLVDCKVTILKLFSVAIQLQLIRQDRPQTN